MGHKSQNRIHGGYDLRIGRGDRCGMGDQSRGDVMKAKTEFLLQELVFAAGIVLVLGLLCRRWLGWGV
jgi:hypothetical protein